MTWAKIIARALRMLGALAEIFRNRQLLNAGKAEQRADDLTEEQERVRKANSAVVRNRADPDRVLRYRD